MNFKEKDLEGYELECYQAKKKLANDVKALSNDFKNIEVIKGYDRCSFNVILTMSDGNKYEINKEWKEYISIVRYPYKYYQTVSSYQNTEIGKIDTSKRMKVLNAKKLLQKIEFEKLMNQERQKLEAENLKKIDDFLESIKEYKFDYSKDYNGKIKSGEWVVNGLKYSFKIGEDGYIYKKIEVFYETGNTIEDFLNLTDNKYIGK